ncbi:Protein SAAL1 [Cricetulus griseus]|uniref:Protein SAAL1 n=1 Tax=Cricetulus griseus TaxID=10029 RepID=G3IKI8_CRIGR|nr:Protein SAAL1 [Cricetulus griseus]
MENEICRVWDMSMDEDVALFLQEFKAADIFMGVLAKSKCPRLREICVGILGNMPCFQEICVSISSYEDRGSENLEGLDVYMHILQLLTTVDDGVQAIVDLPLIDSLIRVLQNMGHCQKKLANSTEEPTNCGSTQDDFHMKILKDISCEFLSNIFQALTKETMAKGLKEGQLSKKKYSCAFQSLLPLYSPVVSRVNVQLNRLSKMMVYLIGFNVL